MKLIILLSATIFISEYQINSKINQNNMEHNIGNNIGSMDTATFGAGCFWCVEAIYDELIGVSKVTSGYSGGHVTRPTYSDVCTGNTGHAEVCQIVYNKDSISYEELLEVFFLIHDPTLLNKQGNDVGTQYRSVIFYHNEKQRDEAEKFKEMLNKSGQYSSGIKTEIVPFKVFYPAEKYHQNYYELNRNVPYCEYVVGPKIEKFRKVFKDKLKKKESLYN